MATLLLEFQVEMEDGTTHEVVADQRDVAKWEVQEFGCPFDDIHSRVHLGYRWLAWSAMTRRGMTGLSWPDFDAQCIEVVDKPEPDEPGDGLDPGQPAPSDTTSSRSRGARASR
ncbi:hypothetical protein ABZ807_09470 [Micromonospora sp. NPDC047548]|uniref:hypothetical protein n=1 Tax=Micromonospora sp. NPDC047548 TaxID=3155624 RepID=UPI0033F40A71